MLMVIVSKIVGWFIGRVPREAALSLNPTSHLRPIARTMTTVKNVELRSITQGFDCLTADLTLPRHRHRAAYASVVVSGAFEESGFAGRLCAQPGDVLIHPGLDAHQNHEVSSTVKLIRLNWRCRNGVGGLFRLDDLDEFVHVAEKDIQEAGVLLGKIVALKPNSPLGKRNDWPDMLNESLVRDPGIALGEWASIHGLRADVVSRGFSKAYGVAPEVFRAELKTKTAWFKITHGFDSLATIANESGFSDQAHMTRWIRRLTGVPPMSWRHAEQLQHVCA